MNVKRIRRFSIFFILPLAALSILFLSGCGSSGGGGGSGGLTPVSVNLNIPSSQALSANGVTTLSGGIVNTGALPDSSVRSIPAAVASIGILITASDMEDITDTFNVSPGDVVEKTYDVPTGNGRKIIVNAYDAPMGGGNVLYSGQTTVDLTGDLTVVDIKMVLRDVIDAINYLNDGDIVKARDLFRAAVEKYAGQNSQEEWTANFFYAITRVLAVLIENQVDMSGGNVMTVTDIIEASGCRRTGTNPLDFSVSFVKSDSASSDSGIVCSNALPPGYPIGQEIHEFINNVLLPEIDGAIANLNNVSELFEYEWVEPFSDTVQQVMVESDYGDVLVLRGILKAAAASLLIIDAYDLNVTISGDILLTTIESFLADNPGFPTLIDSDNLSRAKSYLTSSALDDLEDGINWIREEEDDQLNDWINLVDMTGEEITQALNDIGNVRECINGECTIDDNNTPGDSSDDTVMNFAPYFDGQINISSFIPPFSGDDPDGFLPDPYFGGMLVSIQGFNPNVLNEDEDVDDIADGIDKDIYYVFEGDTLPADPFAEAFRKDPKTEGYFMIGAASAREGIADFYGESRYYFVTSKIKKQPALVDRDVLDFDALKFMDTGLFCCTSSSDIINVDQWWNVYGAPDGLAGKMYENGFMFVEDVAGGTGLRVYTIPPLAP